LVRTPRDFFRRVRDDHGVEAIVAVTTDMMLMACTPNGI
jgi:hypothetical protein